MPRLATFGEKKFAWPEMNKEFPDYAHPTASIAAFVYAIQATIDESTDANLLIQSGADLEALNYLCLTPLLIAAYRGRTGVINVLKKYGADMAALDNEFNSTPHIKVKAYGEPQEETLRLFAPHCN
ncbi:GA repeat binding protein beta 2 [Plakobranchus ocellatus]|uniref:GA repeat binding protein beta 2 n=1 Tax=Plakobranchus ocellatus TaxID=259542 RepID=A0AAV3YLJ0_9GAST|nr:GA repeat binding protein beta 2 [Plakobranchus ocellatus]